MVLKHLVADRRISRVRAAALATGVMEALYVTADEAMHE
jgi:hypothetical protein